VPSSDPVQRFNDIIENIEAIEQFTAGLDLHGFVAADQTIRAAKYSLLVISEAATKLGDLTAELCPSIPWQKIRGLGNRLRHEYHGIDVIRIWSLIEHDLLPLKDSCRAALHRLEESGRT
jgi:uncharacterized protein with HEPN domain